MGSVGRKGRGWSGTAGAALVLFAGAAAAAMGACSLVPEEYPGWAGSGTPCASDAACDDDNPCSEDTCDDYGGCKHVAIDGAGPSDMKPCTRDLCEGGEVTHPPDVSAPCGFSGKAYCNANGECSGCEPATAEEDCGGPEYWCDVVVCRLKGDLGDPCSGPEGCGSGLCQQGACCEEVCVGPCLSCNPAITGAPPGGCAAVPLGMDPDGGCGGGFTCDGAGLCVGVLGSPCTTSSGCSSTYCIDGVCCNGFCNGLCRTCALEGKVGFCEFIPSGQDPADECFESATCSGSGGCVLHDNGETCTNAAECTSSICVDGVCCDGVCTALCFSCAIAGNVGTCTLVPAGEDPADECGGALTCNGSGACM